jgi:hypothetical protein
MKLQKINKIDDWIKEIVKDDPVRPEIPVDHRINEEAEIYALWNDTELGAVTCICYTEGIPGSVEEMYSLCSPFMDTVVFYTIWSYTPGSGRQLIVSASESILKEYPSIQNIVTLSPKTEMAERFHLKNGAWRYRENSETINYAYQLDESRIRT